MQSISLTFAELFSSPGLLLVDSAMKVTVLLVLAAVTTLYLRRDSAATRHFVWLLAVVAMLLVPALSSLLPQWRVLPQWASLAPRAVVPVLVEMDSQAINRAPLDLMENERPPSIQHDEPALADRLPKDRRPVSTPQPTAPSTESAFILATPEVAAEPSRWRLSHVLPMVWLLGVSGLALRLIVARWMLWKFEQQATTVCLADRSTTSAFDPLGKALEAARTQLGMRHSVSLLIHPEKTIPLAWGILRFRLMLPSAAREWDVAQLQSVLLHELAHIKRRDTLAQLLTQIACTLHWFNPLAWIAAWSMGVERERACDDLVLTSGVRASDYAGHLLAIVTQLSPVCWTQSCGLAMARSSCLESRVVAVLSKNLNRRRVSVILAAAACATMAGITVPMAMLRAADYQVAANDQPLEKPIEKSVEISTPQPQPEVPAATDAKPQVGEQLKVGTADFLQWSEPKNGLRAALVIRHASDKPKPEHKPDLYVAVQNVTEQPIRLSDMTVAPQLRYLKIYSKGVIQAGLSTNTPSMTDITLQPRAVVYVLFFGPEPQVKDQRTTGSIMAEGALKDTHESLAAELQIEKAPAGAWTGKLVIAQTTGAVAAGQPQPKDKEAQALFNVWQHHMRANGNFPGGLVGRLDEKVREFITNNTGDTGGDAYARKMAPLVPRLNAARDWTAAEIVALLDDIAAITSIPLETTLKEVQTRTFQSGTPLLPELTNAPWGKPEPNGLRMAWLLEPRADAYPLNIPLKSRIVIHNSGKNSIIFRTRTWHQSSQHQARDAQGANIKVNSTFWTTLGRRVAFRLAPNEYVELMGAGIGVGANKNTDDWQNTRVGAWIDARGGDDITFLPDAVQTNNQPEIGSPDQGPDWWFNFIKATLTQDLPVPTDVEERRRLVYRAGLELFGTPLATEDIMAFVNDREPTSIDSLARRLANRPGASTFKGSLTSGPTKFKVLPMDPDADKKPRAANSPGHYTLGDQVRLIVTRRPVGASMVNEGTIRFFSADPTKPPVTPHDLKLPDNYGTWATAWLRNTTILWVTDQGHIRSIDFTNPAAVIETPCEAGTPNFEKIPKPILDTLRTKLETPTPPKPEAKPPVAPASPKM